jgi:hypothetical protein
MSALATRVQYEQQYDSNALEIFRRGHDGELYGSLISKSLIAPLSDGAEHLDCCDTIVGDEDLL